MIFIIIKFFKSLSKRMTFDIKRTDNWILIENKFLFNPSEVEVGIINLISRIWEEMAYDRGNLLSIDFPGEYDIWWSLIKVFVWNWDKLNFLVTHENVTFWVIQSPEVLELDEVCDMNYRIYPDESIEKKLDQLEMEWTRINLSTLDEMTFEVNKVEEPVNNTNETIEESTENN